MSRIDFARAKPRKPTEIGTTRSREPAAFFKGHTPPPPAPARRINPRSKEGREIAKKYEKPP